MGLEGFPGSLQEKNGIPRRSGKGAYRPGGTAYAKTQKQGQLEQNLDGYEEKAGNELVEQGEGLREVTQLLLFLGVRTMEKEFIGENRLF